MKGGGMKLLEALKKAAKNPHKWFKLSKETKEEFKKAKKADIESRKAGFIFGGKLK